jgi:hypothetical protein
MALPVDLESVSGLERGSAGRTTFQEADAFVPMYIFRPEEFARDSGLRRGDFMLCSSPGWRGRRAAGEAH